MKNSSPALTDLEVVEYAALDSNGAKYDESVNVMDTVVVTSEGLYHKQRATKELPAPVTFIPMHRILRIHYVEV